VSAALLSDPEIVLSTLDAREEVRAISAGAAAAVAMVLYFLLRIVVSASVVSGKSGAQNKDFITPQTTPPGRAESAGLFDDSSSLCPAKASVRTSHSFIAPRLRIS